ncbi:MAG: flavodoxin-dependent (E)-4-hydroxy-3-methylbut-2-enyl-diphosphate synthase [Clostridia bacterium]|nr:flavodoxin-dependent (E)-4-hydroxy-3-methylbut-2-enyl-diphosphate synthase [Clostridia bacterium]
MKRKKTKKIKVGNIYIGGDYKITVQSMLNAKNNDVDENIRQAQKLEKAGCEIIRVAIENKEAVRLIDAIKNKIDIPLVADIHFDYKLALECAYAGVDKIRINPGNIGSDDKVKKVADICNRKNIPIRIGVNSGSLEKEILKKYSHPCAQALRDSALYHTSLLEKFDFDNIILSMKSSDVKTMVKAYELVSQSCDYPLHLGVTEAGLKRQGIVKSSIGIGALLLKGIGDTIRVSLTDDPVNEVVAGFDILNALELRENNVTFISCPTCGRTKVDLISLANEVSEKLKDCKKKIKVAVMGCAVNGPGEAKEADIGIAGGDGCGLIFKKGEIIKKVDECELVSELVKEIERL